MRAGLTALLATALAVLAAADAPGAGPAATVKSTNGWISTMAMDGPRVAYAVSARFGPQRCTRVLVWNVATGGEALVSGMATCEADSTSTGAGVREIAVAGTRVAWIVNTGGNSESNDALYTASLPQPRERKLAEATRTGDVDGILTGTWIGGLVGDASLLAANFWSTAADGTVTSRRLRRLPGLSRLASGAGSMSARSADLGRVAVLGPSGSVNLFSAGGKLLQTITPSSAREIALRHDYLVALTASRTLEIYDARTGNRVRTWPVAAGAAHLDVHAGVAVYAVRRSLWALQLTTGATSVLATEPRAIADVELEAPGVVYSFNTVKGVRSVGHVAYVPLAEVLAALS